MTMDYRLKTAVEALDGQLVETSAQPASHEQLDSIELRGVSIDSRAIRPGQLFVAIVGKRFDGHLFVDDALQAGAAAAVVQRSVDTSQLGRVPLIQVEDTTLALGRLARSWRQTVAPTVVGLTGSVGKTTTKELLKQILELAGPTQCTRGNQNNEIGVPLTLLELQRGTRFAVIEMGMSGAGEIAYLSRLAQPDIACITAIAPVHLEQLGSLEAIAAAKSEIIAGLAAKGQLVSPSPQPLLAPHLVQLDPARRLRFGQDDASELQIKEIVNHGLEGTQVKLDYQGASIDFRLPLPGLHNAHNAAAAAAIALALGVAPEAVTAGLQHCPELGHRARIVRTGRWTLIDDCYNASPVAMRVALQMLADSAAEHPKVAVLGPMFELGDESAALHREVGRAAAGFGLALLVTVGEPAAAIAEGAREAGLDSSRIAHCERCQEAANTVGARAAPDSFILVKASRGARLEQVVETLAAR
jgi:UDP-N-acetylmuramoyl-tripeptide--D-alanyl-D-alanine ligase